MNKKEEKPEEKNVPIPPIMTERPEGMDFELYKALRKLQKERLKIHLKGTHEKIHNGTKKKSL